MIPDWNLAHAFLVTVETGSLSAAARQMGLTQPTLSRQIAELESRLGVTLYERIGKRLSLTEAGQDLLVHAQTMRDAATAMSLAASGKAQSIEGTVRISATDAYCAYILPELVERIRSELPTITVELISSDMISDLRRREADIAIRNVRPEAEELIAKLVRTSKAQFYASDSWVNRRGLPLSPDCLDSEDVVCFSDPKVFAEYVRSSGPQVSAPDFRIVADNSVVAWELVKRGLGVGFMMKEIADRTPGVVNILPKATPIDVPIWLVTHRELRTSRRIRVVFDLLADAFAHLE